MERLKAVDAYLIKNERWTNELELLRETMLLSGLTEAYKWRSPVYCAAGKNVLGLGAFKNHFCIWFFNGNLINDELGKLVTAQEGKDTAMRQFRFEKMDDVVSNIELIEAFALEAKRNSILKLDKKPVIKKPLIIPDILKSEFELNAPLEKAFSVLNLTKKREFIANLNNAKREITKISRLKKMIPLIFEGIGLNDKYRK